MLLNLRNLGKCFKVFNYNLTRTNHDCLDLRPLFRPSKYAAFRLLDRRQLTELSTGKDTPLYSYLQGRDIDDDITVSDSIVGQERNDGLRTKLWQKRERELSRKLPVGESVLEDLQNLFGMTRHEAVSTVQFPKFFLIADPIISETIHTLKDYDISSKQLQRMPWILLQSAGEVSSKINVLCEPYLFQNYFEGLGFCHFPLSKIREYQKLFEAEWPEITHYNNRIYYMAEKLMVPVDLLTEKIVKAHRLLSIDLHRVEAYIELLNRYNIRKEDIVNDLWIFFNNIDIAEKRLQAIISAGCKRPKLWMCRCTEEVFKRSLSRHQSQKDALGECRSFEEYLAKRLACRLQDIRENGDFAKLSTMRVSKAKRVIDMLLSEGFSTKQILSCLRLLKYSEHRTRARIKQLKEIGVQNIIISTLYKSPRSFESYCKSFEKKK
ncbi:transcription termination factor, mitochondrial [Palaemon carinicauda]|uniref:transcription termination factor, mitochondrial n=1 Tax=Palaemon carinicauda TaxID=392227 RepID=UPI0035B68ADE